MIRKFINANYLQIGDAVIAKRNSGIALLDHYIIFLGFHGDRYWFVANLKGYGVRYFDEYEVAEKFQGYDPTQIRRFYGNPNSIFQRLKPLIGNRYDLLDANCEHLANYLQYGVWKSKQADTAKAVGLGSLAVLALILLFGGKK